MNNLKSVARWCVSAVFALSFNCGAFATTTFTVNSTADINDDLPGDGVCHTAAGTCTLRAAISEANRVSGSSAAINLPAGTYTLQIPPVADDDEFSGDLNLTAPISGNALIALFGAGAATTIIDANQLDRAMLVASGRAASIRGVTIRSGSTSSVVGGGGLLNEGTLTVAQTWILANKALYGGAIQNFGTLTLDHVKINQNEASTGAGIDNSRIFGVNNSGILKVRDSSIFDNHSSNAGGGIFSGGTAEIINSTLSQNRANYGAGIYSSEGLTIIDSTIANNQAQYAGGGIYSYPPDEQPPPRTGIFNSTIAGNGAYRDDGTEGDGGGILIGNGFVTVRNSLLVNNIYSGAQGSFEDCRTTAPTASYLQTLGTNLFTTEFGAACNVIGPWSLLNSLNSLGPLKDNGGATQTIALLLGSNAIDAGLGCVDADGHPITTDQRGYPRTVASACDVGAYERDANRIFTDGFDG